MTAENLICINKGMDHEVAASIHSNTNKEYQHMYLYLKKHNKTNLKYLGKTIANDPHLYQGSGKVWKRHIAKHGYDVTTEILLTTDCADELKALGLYYSKLWNIVESKEFANLMDESGDGGAQIWTIESRKKLSETMKKRPSPNQGYNTEDQKLNISKSMKKRLEDPALLVEQIARLRANSNYEKTSKAMSKLKWCNDGIRNYRKKTIPASFVAGRLS